MKPTVVIQLGISDISLPLQILFFFFNSSVQFAVLCGDNVQALFPFCNFIYVVINNRHIEPGILKLVKVNLEQPCQQNILRHKGSICC